MLAEAHILCCTLTLFDLNWDGVRDGHLVSNNIDLSMSSTRCRVLGVNNDILLCLYRVGAE